VEQLLPVHRHFFRPQKTDCLPQIVGQIVRVSSQQRREAPVDSGVVALR